MTEWIREERALDSVLASGQLTEWLTAQRWYSAKSRSVAGLELIEQVRLGEDLYAVLVQTHMAIGTHAVYQLLLVIREPESDGGDHGAPIARSDDLEVYDALRDPRRALGILDRMLEDVDVSTDHGRLAFRHVEGAYRPGPDPEVRAMAVEQSNSSIVIDDRVALKLVRKVESGINPELEMLRFLTARGFEHIPRLEGWWEYDGESLASTLGVAMEFIPDGRDGWDLALDEITTDPDRFVELVADLGRATAQMHTLLASDAGDPAFSPEEPINESLSLLTASIDEDIERIFSELPETDATAPIYGRSADVRANLAALPRLGTGGKNIRIHGDYHLGQALHTPRGWVILDFEGEPARPLPERRQKRSPLRDVAGILRSLAYATSAVELQRDKQAPEGLEQRARQEFVNAYMAEVDPTLLPSGRAAIDNLLAIFELQKAIYELRYELDNRPDWVAIPAACIGRLLEDQ